MEWNGLDWTGLEWTGMGSTIRLAYVTLLRAQQHRCSSSSEDRGGSGRSIDYGSTTTSTFHAESLAGIELHFNALLS